MKRQIAVYSIQRQKAGLDSRCKCIYCHKKDLGEILPRGQQAERLLLPAGWQEGIVPVTGNGYFSSVGRFPRESMWCPFGSVFAIGFFCGDCHAAVLQEYVDMAPGLRAMLYEALLVEFERTAEMLDREGDERRVSRTEGAHIAYHNARRAVRLMGRMLPPKTTPFNWKTVLRENLKEALGNSPKSKSTGVTRHLMTGDIGNPWNK